MSLPTRDRKLGFVAVAKSPMALGYAATGVSGFISYDFSRFTGREPSPSFTFHFLVPRGVDEALRLLEHRLGL